ncbi:MAG: hypothetical protein EOS72_01905 [Mesorhizobium sp.]|nr:MAG: hypothetical protein EOS72_01905 [Mesorhizobium sp.]
MGGALVTSNPSLPNENDADDASTVLYREMAQDDGTPGRTIAFSGANVQPLGYTDLAEARLHEKLTIPLTWENATVIGTDIEGLDNSKKHTVKATLQSVFTSRAIGLVKGGWLPSGLAATRLGTTVLVDRNVVSEIIGRFDGGKNVGAEPDFLDLFADRPVRINPLLFAMEGNARRIPSPELLRSQLDEAVTKLQAALPAAKLVVGPGSLQGALGLIEESRSGFERKQRFLLRVAPGLTSPVSRRNMQARWNEVIAGADACGVSRSSLVVLAALSSVAIPNSGSPAKKLLKFKEGYCEEDAYNALADLRSLEMLIYVFGFFPGELVQLCTADRNLALFWTGIRASNFARFGTGIAFDLSPVEELVPGSKWYDSCFDRSAISGERG